MQVGPALVPVAGLVVAVVVALGLAAYAWFYRGSVPLAVVTRAMGLASESRTAPTLQAAGVHKCIGVAGTSYLDGPCPRGSRGCRRSHRYRRSHGCRRRRGYGRNGRQ